MAFEKWQYTVSGITYNVVSGQNGLSVNSNNQLIVSNTSPLFDSNNAIMFTLVGDDPSIYDTYTVAKISNGKDGANGEDGKDGENGQDGKDGQDALTLRAFRSLELCVGKLTSPSAGYRNDSDNDQ